MKPNQTEPNTEREYKQTTTTEGVTTIGNYDQDKINTGHPTVVFFNSETLGDNISALVRYFTNSPAGDFVLESALKQVKQNNEKIKEFQLSLTTPKKEVA